MEESDSKQPKQATPPEKPSQSPAPKHNGGFLALFGKSVLFLIVAGALVFGGYYFGTKGMKKSETTLSPTPIQSAMNAEPTTLPTPTVSAKKTVKAGPASGTSFKSYSVQIPAGWTDNHETTAVSDKLILTKDDSSITIYQAAIGGGGCVYKGDPPTQMAQQFTNFADITGQSVQFRRSWNDDPGTKTAYTVCQKNTSDGSYGSPTEFGAINLSAHSSDETTLAEIDSIIASLSK
jgi:hypothetical protein